MMGIRVPLAQLVGSVFDDRFRTELQRQGIDCAAINIELLQTVGTVMAYLSPITLWRSGIPSRRA